MLPLRVRARRRARASFGSSPSRLLSWLLSLLSTAIALATHVRFGPADATADTAAARARAPDDRPAATGASASPDAFAVVRIASSSELAELRALASDAAACLQAHPREDNAGDAQLKALKAKADQLFVPHAIALRKVEMAIVDPDRLAMAPGLAAAVSRDLKFLCALAEERYAALRELTWLEAHRRNVEALLRHLPIVTEGELLAAEPITDFDSPMFTAKLRSMRQRKRAAGT